MAGKARTPYDNSSKNRRKRTERRRGKLEVNNIQVARLNQLGNDSTVGKRHLFTSNISVHTYIYLLICYILFCKDMCAWRAREKQLFRFSFASHIATNT